MYPEDRVLVAYVPRPADFKQARLQGWYRIPQSYAPKGLYAEYFAFYFGQRFGPDKWAIHYYATREGHELVQRIQLVPDEPDHPRAYDLYYKVQLGEIRERPQPIVSLRWRRVTFIHTTWDRFQDATEINDLFIEGGEYVDRLYATLKDRGLHPERNYLIRDQGMVYTVPLAIPCADGVVQLTETERPETETELINLVDEMTRAVTEQGGERAYGA